MTDVIVVVIVVIVSVVDIGDVIISDVNIDAVKFSVVSVGDCEVLVVSLDFLGARMTNFTTRPMVIATIAKTATEIPTIIMHLRFNLELRPIILLSNFTYALLVYMDSFQLEIHKRNRLFSRFTVYTPVILMEQTKDKSRYLPL